MGDITKQGKVTSSRVAEAFAESITGPGIIETPRETSKQARVGKRILHGKLKSPVISQGGLPMLMASASGYRWSPSQMFAEAEASAVCDL